MDAIINRVFTDPNNPGGYSSFDRLFKAVKLVDSHVTRSDVKNFLQRNRTYNLFRQRRLKFKRSKIIPFGFLSDLHVDLGDFQSLAPKNKGYRYLLVGVDTFSRRVFAMPIKSKSFADVKDGFERLFASMPYLPQQIFSDRGKEFMSHDISNYFLEIGVPKYKAEASNIKAAFAERMLRTIKNRLYKYFSEKNTTNWISVLPKILNAINHSVCRSTGMRPVDIDEHNASEIWERLYAPLVRDYGNHNPAAASSSSSKKMSPPPPPPRAVLFAKGDDVRISRAKPLFEKGYLPTFSDEVFKIDTVSRSNPPYFYLVDSDGEKIRGRFYQEELLKTSEKDTTYRIEKVLKRRTRKGKKEIYVKFIGYKAYYWINETDIV
jgi:hypothetical protein